MAAPTVGTIIESWIPGINENGLNTLENINFNSGSNTCDLPASTTINGVALAGIGNITSSATTGTMFSVTNTGVYTGASVFTTVANSATTGTVNLMTANGLTTGHLLTLSSSGVITTTGDVLAVVASGATTSTGVVRVTAAALTTGVGILVTANALTSGSGIAVASSSTDTTAHALIKATNTGTGSIAALFGGANVVTSTHFRRIITETGSGVTIWFSDGTTANGALTGVAGDICLNAGSNKPEYCTATTSWTALV